MADDDLSADDRALMAALPRLEEHAARAFRLASALVVCCVRPELMPSPMPRPLATRRAQHLATELVTALHSLVLTMPLEDVRSLFHQVLTKATEITVALKDATAPDSVQVLASHVVRGVELAIASLTVARALFPSAPPR
jgi:hypothetical protein